MRIDERVQNNIVIIEPKERLTVETEAHFTETVRRLVDAGHTRLVLNLADVPYIDSCGLGAIAQAYTSARRRGGELKLVGLTQRSRYLLTITRLLTVLAAYDTEDEAERSFDANPRPSIQRSAAADHAGSIPAHARRRAADRSRDYLLDPFVMRPHSAHTR